jgi:hypothetical protein
MYKMSVKRIFANPTESKIARRKPDFGEVRIATWAGYFVRFHEQWIRPRVLHTPLHTPVHVFQL